MRWNAGVVARLVFAEVAVNPWLECNEAGMKPMKGERCNQMSERCNRCQISVTKTKRKKFLTIFRNFFGLRENYKRLNLQHCKSADLTKNNGRILLLSLFRYSKNDLVTLL